MYSIPVVGGTGVVLGVGSATVLADTGSSAAVTVAVGVAIALLAWGITLLKKRT